MSTQGRCPRPHLCKLEHGTQRTGQRFAWLCQATALVALASSFALAPRARADATNKRRDALLGEWWTEQHEGRVKFVRASDGTYRGITTCCSNAPANSEDPEFDIHNPNPALRRRSTVGIVIIWKLNFDDGKYLGGYVYNPRDGHTYRMKIEVVDNETIEVRGYVGISLFGQTQTWKRAHPVKRAEVLAARKEPSTPHTAATAQAGSSR